MVERDIYVEKYQRIEAKHDEGDDFLSKKTQ